MSAKIFKEKTKKYKALLFPLGCSPVLRFFDDIKGIREELEAKAYAYADAYEYKGGKWCHCGAIGRRPL